jgi:hypothetical protein
VSGTLPIAYFETEEGAREAEGLLHANGIKCAIAEPATNPTILGGLTSSEDRYTIVVASEDEKRGDEALEGLFVSKWWLTDEAGERYLAFDVASPEELRHQAERSDVGELQANDLRRLAGLLDQHGWKHSGEAFHHLLRHDSKLDGRSFDEWATACGCMRVQTDADI